MKNIYLILLGLLSLCSCYSKKTLNSRVENCNENLQFKKSFFEKIDAIENLVSKNQDTEFWESLKFVSKYTRVSYQDTLNYAKAYPYGTFLRDKETWLEWYKENKCDNIQFK